MTDERKHFEAFAKLELGKYPSLYDLPDPFKLGPEDEYFEDAVAFAWAAYEAGEIAMKEKAAELVRTKGNELGYRGTVVAIRALPLSGAEESKKENA